MSATAWWRFLRIVASQRPGGRPERTVYEITDAGRAEFVDRVRDLIASPRSPQSAFKTVSPCPVCRPARS
jgi:DNA-binding PadR family transcriptional regulator